LGDKIKEMIDDEEILEYVDSIELVFGSGQLDEEDNIEILFIFNQPSRPDLELMRCDDFRCIETNEDVIKWLKRYGI